MNSEEIAALLNRARAAIELSQGSLQRQVYITLPPMDLVSTRALLDELCTHPKASSEQRQEAVYLLADFDKKFSV